MGTVMILILAAAFLAAIWSDALKHSRKRREREEFRHIIGAKQWWGKR